MVADTTSNEREPLLAAQHRKPTPSTATPSASTSTPAPTGDDEEDDELAVDASTTEQRRRSLIKWLVFWALVAGVVVFCIVEAFKDGGGEFDWKGALKKAGGGVSLCPC
jgi:hypothetical protein